MKLTPGTPAPDFSLLDLEGNPVQLADYRGKRVLLSFYRYASCPLCNLRVHRLLGRIDHLKTQGLHLLAVYESSPTQLGYNAALTTSPFPILADPSRTLYRRYGVDTSMWGMIKGMARHMGTLMSTMMRGKMRAEGAMASIPADFLIEADGVIAVAYYGSHIADHLPMEQIEDWLGQS
ncbi:MAG: hypothetical protein AUJ55_01025 [Proteobacteria bacterium CG1_02_64_396]|nr:MAG: hypothetical protein AUJ55_01025 [Proteobacteria bacterium CG1_02_64_396]